MNTANALPKATQACLVQLENPAGEHGIVHGRMTVPTPGTVCVSLTSPRPVRIRIGGVGVVEEDLSWRRYERLIRAIFVIHLPAGQHAIEIEYGPRSHWPKSIDHDCPSRNREKVRAGLLMRLPDQFSFEASVTPERKSPTCTVRILPTQCVIAGVIWQHVLVRTALGHRAIAPSIMYDRPGRLPATIIGLRSPIAPFDARDITGEAEHAAGLRRLLVPVANAEHPLPLARSTGAIEERIEPEAVIVQHLTVTLHDATPPLQLSEWEASLAPVQYTAERSDITCSLPVHEGQGRQAPVREFREVSWPDSSTLRAALPRPQVPVDQRGVLAIWDHAWNMLLRLRRRADPHAGLPNDYFGTAMEGFSDYIFVWDSCFTTMAAAWGWRAYPAHANLDCLHSRQFDGGYIPRESDVTDGTAAGYEPDFSPNPPIQVVAEWKLAALTGNHERLRKIYPILAAQHHWLISNRGLPNGTLWTTGLANGLDNSPSLGEGYPCLTGQMAHAAELLGRIAGLLGLPEEAASWTTEKNRLGEALNRHLWSDELGIYSTSLADGGHNPNKVVTGFWPLWAGIVPPDRCERLAKQLLDPTTFWRHHPLPSLAADSPHFCPPGDYWKGSVWAPTTAAAIWGFARSGRHDLARKAATRHLEVLTEVFTETGALWENFCSERSERGSWSGRDYSWTSVGPIALLLEIVIGIEPDALANRIRWNVPSGSGWGIEQIPLGQTTIDVLTLDGGKIRVRTNKQFTLELIHENQSHLHEVPIGESIISW